MEIVPAIEEKTVEEFSLSLRKVASFAPRIQVDFNDGSFGGFTTVKPANLHQLVTNLPEGIIFEAHLMVQQPRKNELISELVNLGFKKIIIQYEIEDDVRVVLEEIRSRGLLAGVAIAPETALFDIEPLTDLLDTVTVMDIEPGKQGQKFLERELQKIRELKEGNFAGEVQADGGINEDSILEVFEAGADTGVVGSYIVKAANPSEAYENLLRLI